MLAGFTRDDWSAPTRCADWSAHDVVRHLCDCNAILAGTDEGVLDVTAGFDPRTSPRRWPAILASESPEATLARFLDTSRGLLALARKRMARAERYDVRLPYGPMDWTVPLLHGFWDSWLHERDILLALGRAPVAAVLSKLPASTRTALSRMADFFNTPATPRPT